MEDLTTGTETTTEPEHTHLCTVCGHNWTHFDSECWVEEQAGKWLFPPLGICPACER